MLIALHSQLRSHRRKVWTVLALLAATAVVLTAHSAFMDGGMSHQKADAAAVCIAAASSVAVIAGAVFALRRPAARRGWLLTDPASPEPAFVPVESGFQVRAGPPPLLQVFRL